MSAFALDPNADDQQLLAAVIGYYQRTLQTSPEATAYLQKRGLTHPQLADHFRLGYGDRSLGKHLPIKQLRAGEAIRLRLQRIGLYRESGSEHFRGSITIPLLAADGTGRIVDIYGRKVRDDLRKGTPTHTHLNATRAGVFNVGAFGTASEIVLCSSIWDALTLWNFGYRNCTAMFGGEEQNLTADTLEAFAEFGIRRVLTTAGAVVPRLLTAGIEVFTVRMPVGGDLNAFALSVGDPAAALGDLLRSAGWEGKGTKPVVVEPPAEPPAVAPASIPEASSTEPSECGPADREDEPAPVLTATPLPLVPAEPEVRITPTEVLLLVGNRTYRVRGLERNAGIDTLKINLLVSNSVGSHLDTFDLYAAKPRAGFIEQAAGELRIEPATVKKDLGRLLLELEKVQDDRLRVNQPANALPEMTQAEQDAALRLLLDPLLLDRIAGDISVVGERTNKLAAFLAVVSRKLDQPLAVVVQSTSAAGKSTLVDAVLDLCPPEDVVRFSAMTGQSLYYLADGSLRHKVLAIAEEEGASRAAYALKLLQSDGELTIASTGKDAGTGRLTTQTYTVSGPVSLITTTTSTTVDEELLNRCLVLSVDEDRNQTRAIHDRQRRRQTLDGLLEAEARNTVIDVHRNAQRLLRPLRVVNPFAEKLSFPVSATRTRRDHAKYLTLIRAITLLFQHQRPVRTTTVNGKPVEFIETSVQDIAVANELAHEVLGRSLDELPPQTRNLLTLLDDFVAKNAREQSVDKEDVRFTRREVREAIGWGDTQLKIHLRRLVDLELVVIHRGETSRSVCYELAVNDLGDRNKLLPGLVDPATLNDEYDGLRSGLESHRSGSGRGAVGTRSGGGRAAGFDATPDTTTRKGNLRDENAELRYSDPFLCILS